MTYDNSGGHNRSTFEHPDTLADVQRQHRSTPWKCLAVPLSRHLGVLQTTYQPCRERHLTCSNHQRVLLQGVPPFCLRLLRRRLCHCAPLCIGSSRLPEAPRLA